MFGTTQDITDRKRAEEERQALSSALQQSNARLEEAQRLVLTSGTTNGISSRTALHIPKSFVVSGEYPR